MKDRHALTRKLGLGVENCARGQIGSLLAIVANTIPTAFLMLVYIYSDSSLLNKLRGDLSDSVHNYVASGPSRSVSFNVHECCERCPLLVSVYEEVLRMTSGIAQIRHVNQETSLADGRYVLRPGAMIQMPTGFLHHDPMVWGDQADIFSGERFLKNASSTSSEKSQLSKRRLAYQPFGGGTSLCPGRHFAFNEIMTFMIAVVVGFDVKPRGDGWTIPKMDKSRIPMSSLKPLGDISVTISRRVGWQNLRFH